MTNPKYLPDFEWLRGMFQSKRPEVDGAIEKSIIDGPVSLVDLAFALQEGSIAYVDADYGGFCFKIEHQNCDGLNFAILAWLDEASSVIKILGIFTI